MEKLFKTQLEYRLFYCIVAERLGTKEADRFMEATYRAGPSRRRGPFVSTRYWAEHGMLLDKLRENGLKYPKDFVEVFSAAAFLRTPEKDHELNLRTCTLRHLEMIRGLKPKVARHFLNWTRLDENFVVLDHALLSWLWMLGQKPGIWKQWARYAKLERMFLAEANCRCRPVRNLGLEVREAFKVRKWEGIIQTGPEQWPEHLQPIVHCSGV